ncbi:MAG: ABC transporter permease [Bacteroidales bacterium]|jgi:putative ABC transport system permease protein|nr:ABC transporter permease [Bacteroidales bacterium]
MKIKQLYQRYIHDVYIAVEAIFAHKVKSFLTALGIIFGVAAVISMLAIGNGAQAEIMEQIKMVGVNNIIISPKTTEDSTSDAEADDSNADKNNSFSPGLSLKDAESIKELIPSVNAVCPIISFKFSTMRNGKSKAVNLEGTTNDYFKLFNIELQNGQYFNPVQTFRGDPVCIIGHSVKRKFFNQENPIGQQIRCGSVWLTVVGVVDKQAFNTSSDEALSISSTDNKIFIPVQTMLMRYKNRTLVREDKLENNSNGSNNKKTLHQIDKIIVQVDETEYLTATSDIVSRMMLRRHNGITDFEIAIPELLLKQQQRTKNIFNVVLGAIAGISLIVGGIGIMNIMLASVMERIREIGTRQAIGASRKDIVIQFLAESTLISISGGVVGIILGVALAKIISSFFDIKTIVSFASIFIAFGVSVVIGITFGYLPAKNAAEKDPVESLRSGG